MKLNPPASSSDLEAAREIARRLHQRRRRADFERGDSRRSPADAPAPDAAWPTPSRRTQTSAPAEAAPPRISPPPLSIDDESAPPSWDDTEADEPEATGDHLAGALDGLTDESDALGHPAPGDGLGDEAVPEPPDPGLPSFDEDEPDSLDAPPEPDMPGIDIEDVAVSPDEMVGAGEGGDEGDELDEPLAGSELDAPPADGEAEPVAALGSTEELFDEPPPPPSWDDVVEACREIAGASGAMIIDPAGQVFAARGEWPEPGPDAIAGRLVAMMERTLKDAPTRSVSAPVGGQHLTAWRVPLAEGLVTAAFIADSPLRSESRSAIDAEIHRGAGA